MKNHPSAPSIKKTNGRAKHNGMFRPAKTNRAADALIAKASRITHQAADATVDHVVRPAVNATRNAALAIEARADQTNRFMSDTLQTLENEFHGKPARTLSYAVGLGVMIGLWLRRK